MLCIVSDGPLVMSSYNRVVCLSRVSSARESTAHDRSGFGNSRLCKAVDIWVRVARSWVHLGVGGGFGWGKPSDSGRYRFAVHLSYVISYG